jgi:polar amino acid transport system substrate-binding protein
MKNSDAQQAADPRIADLVRSGKLRVALFLPQYTEDPVTGEIRGQYTGTVIIQIADALAPRLGVEVQLVGYPAPPAVVECIKAGACDVALVGINLSRAAEVGFTPPLVLYPFTYLVPAGSSI